MKNKKNMSLQKSPKNRNRTQLTIPSPNSRPYSLNQKFVSSLIRTTKLARKEYNIQGDIVRSKNKKTM